VLHALKIPIMSRVKMHVKDVLVVRTLILNYKHVCFVQMDWYIM